MKPMPVISAHLMLTLPFASMVFFISSTTEGTELILVNNCMESIWPGILGTGEQTNPKEGGFLLWSGEQVIIQLPENWSGRIWPRKGCCFNETTGKGSCQTGDCAGRLKCRGIGGVPPATLVEMTFGTATSHLHYYDVSLVEGFNVPVSITPIGGGGGFGCRVASCKVNFNTCCPSTLVVEKEGRIVGCKSACLAAKTDRYCCTGRFSTPKTCRPSLFSIIFKAVCPQANSFPFDDALMTCIAPRYVITFCPS